MKTRLFRAAVVALVALGASRANAQITTVVASPKRADAKAQAVAQRTAAAQDSVARVTLTDMKAWVDSAAASLALRPDTGTAPTDTGVSRNPAAVSKNQPEPQANRPADSAAARRRVVESPPEFRDGARAPDTATWLPTIAVLGVALLIAGFAVRRWRPAKVRPGPRG